MPNDDDRSPLFVVTPVHLRPRDLDPIKKVLTERAKRELLLSKLYDAVVEWRQEYKPTCVESLLQVDRVNESLPDLAEAVLDVVGYHDPQDEEA